MIKKKQGFTLIEMALAIAIMAVLIAVLAPALVRHVENSRMRKDETAMDEVVNTVNLALSKPEIFDEAFDYSVENNYMTYTDSSGVYGTKDTDEECWTPDGTGHAVTITFNPDKDGNYFVSQGVVNNMTLGNGSIASQRVTDTALQGNFAEMGEGILYNQIIKSIGDKIQMGSSAYAKSSYTIFIKFELVEDTYRAYAHGEFNGTNL